MPVALQRACSRIVATTNLPESLRADVGALGQGLTLEMPRLILSQVFLSVGLYDTIVSGQREIPVV
jgi:hypothetical protein